MPKIIFPKHLQPGDQVALIAPSFIPSIEQVQRAEQQLQSLNLQVVNTFSTHQPDGYFAGSAAAAAASVQQAFADPNIKALIGIRGGYGCARLLALLDWERIRANPKIILGFSDMTSLLIAIQQKTGLVTFHGPSASLNWSQFSKDSMQEILFDRFSLTKRLTTPEIKILKSGQAQGELIGGNLSVLVSLIGSPYLPTDWRNKILFLEDVNEEVYRLDRMLMQLKLANILSQIKGLIFGSFQKCTTRTPNSFTVLQLLDKVAQELSIPVIADAPFGHQPDMITFPVGAEMVLNAGPDFMDFKII